MSVTLDQIGKVWAVRMQLEAAKRIHEGELERALFSDLEVRPVRKLTPEEAFNRWANEMNGCDCDCHDDYYS